MFERLTLFMVVTVSLAGCHGQADAGSFTYRLHKPQNNDEFSTLHTMPDGALLVVTKRLEQPKQIWKLRRIADWETSDPREDELDIDVGPNDEALNWADQEDRWDRNAQLMMDPAGNYLVVRLSAEDADHPPIYEHPDMPLRSVLNVIDLHGFKLLSRVVVTDRILAAGDMGFSPSGAFVASGRSATIVGKVIDTDQYAVETLTLPGLKPETVCSYTEISRHYIAPIPVTPEHPFPVPTPVNPEESARVEKENQEFRDEVKREKQAADTVCRPNLAPLGFSSLDDVYDHLNWFAVQGYPLAHSPKVLDHSPGGCLFGDLSANQKYVLFDCDESRAGLTFLFYYRGFRVFDVEDGTQIMDLKLLHSLLGDLPLPWVGQYSGVLATSGGVTYVVLLRNGAKLEGYRVP